MPGILLVCEWKLNYGMPPGSWQFLSAFLLQQTLPLIRLQLKSAWKRSALRSLSFDNLEREKQFQSLVNLALTLHIVSLLLQVIKAF